MTYSFLTTKSWRIDAEGSNPKQAYKIAQDKLLDREKLDTTGKHRDIFGVLSGTYFKYNKNGLHAVDGQYYQIKIA